MNALDFTGPTWAVDSEELDPELLGALIDCGQSGASSGAVQYVIDWFEVTGNESDCKGYLEGYGAWDEDQLDVHDDNLQRLVWLTGCGLVEEGDAFFDGSLYQP